MDAEQYLTEVKSRMIASPVVVRIEVVEQYVLSDRGYIRARLTLINSDFLETAEYFVFEAGTCVPVRYRYQWMDETKRVLRKRWDNVEHFPNLLNFPYHVHLASESSVEPGHRLSTIDLLDLIEHELKP